MSDGTREVTVELPSVALPGSWTVPAGAVGVVVFVHGSGSSRHSPRNNAVADRLNDAGFATLLFDLLTAEEAGDRGNVFDIPLLAGRTAQAVDWVVAHPDASAMPVGLFGASTGAAAALDAAHERPDQVAAVVSRGGRPDLAEGLRDVAVPVLLVVGGDDHAVLGLNRDAAARLRAAELEVVPGAGHLFEGPGELERVADLAIAWFRRTLAP